MEKINAAIAELELEKLKRKKIEEIEDSLVNEQLESEEEHMNEEI